MRNDTLLDKIRAEIAEEHNDCMEIEHYDEAYGLELALGIIDKYRESAEYIVQEVWKCGYINGYNKSQKEAYDKGKEVGKEEMYRQMTGTLA